jgi:hypothetical protein
VRHTITLDTWAAADGWRAVVIGGLPRGVIITAGPVSTQEKVIDQAVEYIHNRRLHVDDLVIITNGRKAAS